MGDSKAHASRFQKFLRRASGISTTSSSASPGTEERTSSYQRSSPSTTHNLKSPAFPSLRNPRSSSEVLLEDPALVKITNRRPAGNLPDRPKTIASEAVPPTLTFQEPSPELFAAVQPETKKQSLLQLAIRHNSPPTPDSRPVSPSTHPAQNTTSLKQPSNPGSLNTQALDERLQQSGNTQVQDYFGPVVQSTRVAMPRRKIWVKRPGASPTLVQVTHDDTVDDVRDMILRKYANSLGRNFDAPDVTIRIIPRERSQQETERTLGPEEDMYQILEAYYPGGQSIDEALVIDVPQRRTPRASPRITNLTQHYFEEHRPIENGSDYFPPMPAISPGAAPRSIASHEPRHSYAPPAHPHSIAIVGTGHFPPLPSPREWKSHHRPKYGRQHTSSPTSITGTGPLTTTALHPPRLSRPRIETHPTEIPRSNHAPVPPPLPTPPASVIASNAIATEAPTPPLDHVDSLRPKARKSRKQLAEQQDGGRASSAHPFMPGLLEGIVPPINVLIVEDNIINLKLLEAFVKRLKVRWQTAMNGRDAVTKWRTGGFHLVLMDIQLPIMNGLEATKEIRRLEKVNSIGAFAKSEGEDRAPAQKENGTTTVKEKVNGDGVNIETLNDDDKLNEEELFRCPVIIVALTASSLQSDRHEALAAGCNDFLTKPVNFLWFERKVMEWGCMQALIDFDGWRKWKDFAAQSEVALREKEKNMDPATRAKQEKRDAKRAALLARMGQN